MYNQAMAATPKDTEPAPKKKHGGARKGAGRPVGIVAKKPRNKLSDRDKAEVIDMHLKGISAEKIAKTKEVSASCIKKSLKAFKPVFENLEKLEDFRRVRTNLLESAELMCLESVVSEEKHSKASLNNAAYALAQVHGIRRLEQGLSTDNKMAISFVNVQTIDSLSYDAGEQVFDSLAENEKDSRTVRAAFESVTDTEVNDTSPAEREEENSSSGKE